MPSLGTKEFIILVIIAIILFGAQAPKLVAKFFNTTKEIKKEVEKGVETLKKDDGSEVKTTVVEEKTTVVK